MDIIRSLRDEREELVARIAMIDQMLRQHEEWGRKAQQLIALTNVNSGPPSKATAVDNDALQLTTNEVLNEVLGRIDSQPHPYRNKTSIKEFEKAVIDVLRESGKPMDRVDIYEALTKRGIVIGDGNRDRELNALSARIYRMAQEAKITNERGKGYQLNSPTDTSVFD